jgi:DNA-binding NarL/FixJ family response regulator
MCAAKSEQTVFADLRRRAMRRRTPLSERLALVRSLLDGCELQGIEERVNGFAFRFGADDTPAPLVTVFVHRAPGDWPLTTAEADIADALCTGRTLAQIAHLRGVSINTVKSQVRQVFRKLNVASRVALARCLFP